MELEIFKKEVKTRDIPPQAYTLRNGTLYFNAAAIRKHNLKGKYFNIARNKSDKELKNIYLLESDKEDPSALRVTKGNYYNATRFFDQIGLDYKSNAYHYRIVETSYEERRMLVLVEYKKEPHKKKEKL